MSDPMTPAVPDPTVEALREVLAAHQWHHTRTTHCACGFRTPLAQLAVEGYVDHVVERLAPLLAARAAAPDALPDDEMPDAMVVRTPPKPETAREQEFYNRGYAKGRQDYRAEAAAAPDVLTAVCSQCGERSSSMVKIGTTDGWCTVCLDEAAEPAPDALRVAAAALLTFLDKDRKFWIAEAEQRHDTFTFVHRDVSDYLATRDPHVAALRALLEDGA